MIAHPPRLTASELRLLALRAEVASGAHNAAHGGCQACAALVCPGWESLPGGFDERVLETVATLCEPDSEPTWAEHHPNGTRTGSPDAPIAVGFYPYDRCDVARCRQCGRGILRYTETGGYYSDARIRDLVAALVVGDVEPDLRS